jgi:hypothetical protein
MATQMGKLQASDRVASGAAEHAISAVLGAERAARENIERAEQQAHELAELTRAQSRALAERTERRIRCLAAAFEAELAVRLAELDSQASHMAQAHVLGDDELASLERAVAALACELSGAPP